MVQVLSLFLILIISLPAYGGISNLTCSKKGTSLFFINGVLVDDLAFRQDFYPQAESFYRALDFNKIDVKSDQLDIIRRHNQSEGLLRDIAESYFLYISRDEEKEKLPLGLTLELLVNSLIGDDITLEQMCMENKTRDLCIKIKEIILDNENNQTMIDLAEFKKVAHDVLVTNEKKLIFVTHSGGNLMADRVRDFIKHGLPPEYYDLTGHVSLARPYHTTHKNVETIVFEQDGVIAGLRLAGQNTPKGNVDLTERCDTFSFLPWFNHGFDCYLGTNKVKQNLYDIPNEVASVEVVKEAVYKVASRLENNDENCCEKQKKGKIWLNKNGEEYANGGYVSNDTKIEGDYLFIDPSSNLCGKSTINATDNLYSKYFGTNNTIWGEYEFPDQFYVYGTKSSKVSNIKLESNRHLMFGNSDINGNLSIKTPFTAVTGVVLNGNLEISKCESCQDPNSSLNNLKVTTKPNELTKLRVNGTSWFSSVEFKKSIDFGPRTESDYYQIDHTKFTINPVFPSLKPKTFISSNSQFDETMTLSLKGESAVKFYNMKFENPLSFTGDEIEMRDVKFETPLSLGKNCTEKVSSYLTAIDVSTGNNFVGSVSIFGSDDVKENYIQDSNLQATCDSFFHISTKSNILNLTANAYKISGFYPDGIEIYVDSIGSNVSVTGAMKIIGYDSYLARIGSGVSILGPYFADGCNIISNPVPGTSCYHDD